MSKKKNKDNDISVKFIGNSSIDVTQSAVLIEYKNKQYLLECGLAQGYSTEKSRTLNEELISKINIKKLQCIWISHPHCDHLAMTPALFKKEECHAKVYCTEETKELGKLLLLDSAYISKKDTEYLSKKHKNNIQPLYNENDVINTYENTIPCDKGIIYQVDENVSFKLLNNNHCLGACQIEVFIKKQNSRVIKIVYTGDLGSHIRKDKPFITDIEYSIKSNLHIFEGTYGLKSRSYDKKYVELERKDIKENITRIIKNGGKVLLPTFSFSRTQEVLVDLYNMFKNEKWFEDIPIIIDSKLSVEITGCYHKILKDKQLELLEEVTSWKNVKMNKDIKGTKAILSSDKPCIVCSSQGFMDAGRSQLYGKSFLPNEKDGILIVGYCPDNSVGGRIINPTTKSVKIGDKVYMKRCFIKAYHTYSSHCQHNELISYMAMVNTDKIIIHHSSKEAKKELINSANEYLISKNKTTPIIGSQKDMEIIL